MEPGITSSHEKSLKDMELPASKNGAKAFLLDKHPWLPRLVSRLCLALHQRYRHRYGLVISFALFHTETCLYISPSISTWGNFTHLTYGLAIENRTARGAEHGAE